MPGFCFSNSSAIENMFVKSNGRVVDQTSIGSFWFARSTLNRFMDDKSFGVEGNYFVISEGVILNKKELLEREKCKSVSELLVLLYIRNGNCFCDELRGPFSGLLYDIKQNKVIVFTNHYGDKTVYYSQNQDGTLVVGSRPKYILDVLRRTGNNVSINESALYQMLSYGFLFDENTYANEISRLLPGSVLVFENGSLSTETYYRPKGLPELPNSISDEEIIDNIDSLFRKAVELEFEKDIEYGYMHLCDLSGGLDSRMTTWVACDLGFSNILNISYCQQGNMDEKVASRIACYLKNELLFKPLDDASFLFDEKRIIAMNSGSGLYSGITGGESLLRKINFETYGLEHTGQIGDVVIGSFIKRPEDLHRIEHAGAYSNKLIGRLSPVLEDEYLDREQYLLCTRAFMGALSTHSIRQYYTEATSPFLNVELMDYCFSIPAERRMGHSLYKKWIQTKYPKAADFIWEKTGYAISDSWFVKSARSIVKYAGLGARLLLPGSRLSSSGSMNPFEYWESTRPDVVGHLKDSILRKEGLPISKKLDEDLNELLRNGKCIELTQAVTAVLAAEYYVNFGAFSE